MATFTTDLITGKQHLFTGTFDNDQSNVTGATNGLSVTNKNIGLGGTLINDTTINLNSNELTFSNGFLKYQAHPIFSGSTQIIDKEYADNIVSGLRPKESVLVATVSNIALSGLTTIDSIPITLGDRILVKNQNDAKENGIYSASTTTWNRTSDFDGSFSGEVVSGSYVFVSTGNTNANNSYVLDTQDPITVGSTELNFVLFNHVNDLAGGTGIDVNTINDIHYIQIKPAVYNIITGSTTIQISGVTLIQSGWTLNVSTSLYEYNYYNSNINSNSIVTVIPENVSYTTVINAYILPKTNSYNGYVRLYCQYYPIGNILALVLVNI